MRKIRAAVVALLVAALTLPAVPANATTDSPSDIPGIPLPAAVVSGTLGGPIYDVVYRLDVPAGYVIIAGLTGTPGTDFDLYLFNASATTVVNNAGVVASSTGPTSTEAFSYPTRIPGTFYIDLNGATNVEGTYTLSVQVVPDPTPPSVRLLLDGGASATNSAIVSATIIATDDLSGISEMAFSSDGLVYGPWEPYAATMQWPFLPGDGAKTLWVKVTNGVGLESTAVASIVLDTVAPTLLGISPAPNSTTTDLRPRIIVTFSGPIDPSSWIASGLVLQSATGGVVPGTLTYDARTNAGEYVPTGSLTPGSIYFATLGQPRDFAGNIVSGAGSWWIRPVVPTAIAFSQSPPIITFGSSATLSGSCAIPGGETANLESKTMFDNDFVQLSGASFAAGPFSTSVKPSITTTYRVSYRGSDGAAASTSRPVAIAVRWWVVLTGRGPGIVRSATAGRSLQVQARVEPIVPGATVSFRLYRYDAVRRSYAYVGSRGTRTRTDGTASISWTPSAGRWQWRVAVGSVPGYSAATSAAYTWAVSR